MIHIIMAMVLTLGYLSSEELMFGIDGHSNYVYIATIDGTMIDKVEVAEIGYNVVVILPQSSIYKDGAFSIVCDLTVKGAIGLAKLNGSVVFNADGTVGINGKIGSRVPKGFVRRK